MQAVDEERDSKFPAWRRRDATRWARWKFYPLGLLTMPFRLVFIHVQGMILVLLCTILTMCHNFKKGPLKEGILKNIVGALFSFNGFIWMLFVGIWTTREFKEMDYTEYLGPNYKEKYRSIKKTSTVVCNHVSWVDTQNLY